MGAIETMLQEARTLLEAIEQENSEAIEAAHSRFLEAVERAWARYQRGEITTAVRGLPRAMYLWVKEDLPHQLRNPDRWAEARRELAQFIRTVEHVVEPQEG
ncbi:MAG: hypothetical protein RMK65_01175 [Anaerolineae bacterium]|nr:hypothetical protein [Anaerolineae bacterium]MCX8067880.1 hypothetical protein [Anaerolineae bacterium]MDW7990758.1 hypothetical protein [Anaerolineae bacterium]